MKKIDLENKTIFITGVVGFIGFHLANRLLKNNSIKIIGLDNMSDYYDVNLKEHRLSILEKYNNFQFVKGNLSNKDLIEKKFKDYKPSIVVNLAAQTGVRYSIENPDVYIESNIIGFYNILECCRHNKVEHLIYASSSSVYGDNINIPYSVDDKVDTPVSLYAATKKSNELFAYSYSKLYDIPCTGLRFFTVYGPLGRPDMAYFKFTDSLVKKEKIKLYNYGKCKRDFTYIDDVVEGIFRVIQGAPENNNSTPPYAVYNIGNSNPVKMLDFVQILYEELIKVGVLPDDCDIENHQELIPMQLGDVHTTYADTKPLEKDYGFKPDTSLRIGLRKFAEWYKDYNIDSKK